MKKRNKMKCNHCGKEIVDDSVFCEYCGKKVGTAPKRPLLIIIIVAVVLLAMVITVGLLRQSSVPEAGTVLSYTERIDTEDGYDDVTSYFVFRENNEVIWLMGMSRQDMFPVGFGKYNPSTSEISFSATDTLHQGISLYYGVEDAIVFSIDMTEKTAVLKTDDVWLKPFYNDGNAFTLNKEDYTLEPSEALVGSLWRDQYYGDYIVFKSWNEVLIIEDDGEEEPHAYVCFDDMMSIKTGDNLEYENLIGEYQEGDEMTLCRKGLDTVSHSDECITLRRITAESDTAAFQACQTVDDYRDYIRSYGPNARFYTVAKDFVDEYVSDSTAYTECTTIKACDAYMDTYPDGHFVEEVRTRKVELQNNSNQVLKQGNIYVLTDSNIENFIAYSYNTPVIVDFYGDWCPPCKKMKPILNELANEYNGRVFLGRFNVESMHKSRACKKFGIEVVPNLLFIKNGEIMGRHIGFKDGDKEGIRNEIEKYFFNTNQYGNSSLRKKQLEDQGYVDLGLPSGTLWATCNVGASKPEDYGSYFAWGETTTKKTYDWDTYKYDNGFGNKLTKYCSSPDWGYKGFTDNKTALQADDDPAAANWGSGWYTPTKAQWDELLNNTTNQWTTQNGVKGLLFTSKKNGRSLFLPAASGGWGDELGSPGFNGYYWSRSLGPDYPCLAWSLSFVSDNCFMRSCLRGNGFSVRPVREK